MSWRSWLVRIITGDFNREQFRIWMHLVLACSLCLSQSQERVQNIVWLSYPNKRFPFVNPFCLSINSIYHMVKQHARYYAKILHTTKVCYYSMKQCLCSTKSLLTPHIIFTFFTFRQKLDRQGILHSTQAGVQGSVYL